MTFTCCLICSALTVGQTFDRGEWSLDAQLAPGMELVYAGAFTEESLIPNVQHQRHYRLQTSLFVLGNTEKRWDVAFLTAINLRQGNSDAKPAKDDVEGSVRLEFGSLEPFGRLRPAPGATLAVPLAGPPTIDCGMAVEVPASKVGKNYSWEVNEEGRPPRAWEVLGTEAVNGVTCVKIKGEQQSPDWDAPRGDRVAWRRFDTVWISPQNGLVYKVERIIERRDPARRDPTQRLVARYELESRFKFPSRLFEDRRHEVLQAKKFHEEAKPLLLAPVQYRNHITALQRKIVYYKEHYPATPYRKAIVHLETRLDAALKGGLVLEPGEESPSGRPGIGIGQRVPDFVVQELTSKDTARLTRHLGRPVLLFFFNPASDSGREVLAFAQRMHDRHSGKLGVMAMAVTSNQELARKSHAAMKLSFPLLDGQGLHQTFGVDATPRVILLDGAGVVQSTYTGWGYHVPDEIAAELSRLQKQSNPQP